MSIFSRNIGQHNYWGDSERGSVIFTESGNLPSVNVLSYRNLTINPDVVITPIKKLPVLIQVSGVLRIYGRINFDECNDGSYNIPVESLKCSDVRTGWDDLNRIEFGVPGKFVVSDKVTSIGAPSGGTLYIRARSFILEEGGSITLNGGNSAEQAGNGGVLYIEYEESRINGKITANGGSYTPSGRSYEGGECVYEYPQSVPFSKASANRRAGNGGLIIVKRWVGVSGAPVGRYT